MIGRAENVGYMIGKLQSSLRSRAGKLMTGAPRGSLSMHQRLAGGAAIGGAYGAFADDTGVLGGALAGAGLAGPGFGLARAGMGTYRAARGAGGFLGVGSGAVGMGRMNAAGFAGQAMARKLGNYGGYLFGQGRSAQRFIASSYNRAVNPIFSPGNFRNIY